MGAAAAVLRCPASPRPTAAALLGKTSIEEPAAGVDSAAEKILNSQRSAALQLSRCCYGMVYYFFFLFLFSPPPPGSRRLGFSIFWGNGKAGRFLCILAECGFPPRLDLPSFLRADIGAGGINLQRWISPIGSQIPLIFSVFSVLLCSVAEAAPFLSVRSLSSH